MNAIFAQDVMDHRHAALVAEAEQSRRYQAARAAAAATRTRPTPRIRAVRRPFAAVHAWLVAGVL